MTDSSLGPNASLSGYTRCTMLESLAISLKAANMTLRTWGHGEPERLSDSYSKSQNRPSRGGLTAMNDAQIDKAEQLLSYYECHGMNWRIEGDVIGLLRDLLPDWSAFKEGPSEVVAK